MDLEVMKKDIFSFHSTATAVYILTFSILESINNGYFSTVIIL